MDFSFEEKSKAMSEYKDMVEKVSFYFKPKRIYRIHVPRKYLNLSYTKTSPRGS